MHYVRMFLLGCLLAAIDPHASAAPVLRLVKSGPAADNLLRNGDFEQDAQASAPAHWRPGPQGGALAPGAGRNSSTGLRAHSSDGKGWFGASQTLRLNRTNTAPILVSGWSKAEQAGGSPDADYSLYVDLEYQDGSPLWGQTARFNCGTHDWERRELMIIPEQPVKTLTLHCLFRNHPGTVLFDDLSVSEITASGGAVLFQGTPVVPVDPVRKSTKGTKTQTLPDGTALAWNSLDVTSVSIHGQALPGGGPGGFMVRDVAAGSDVYDLHDGVCPELGLKLQANIRAEKDHFIVDGQLADTTGRDRAVMLVFALPIDATGWTWADDIRRTRVIGPGGEYANQTSADAGSTGTLSLYPIGAIYNDDHGIALGIDMAQPAIYRAAYHAGTRQLLLAFDFGLARDTINFPGAGPFRIVIYRFDPRQGFRGAWDKYMRIFPAYFQVRSAEQGIWMPFTDVSTVPGWRDFGFKYHEGNNNVPFDDTNRILSFRYTEPMTWWMRMKPELPRTDEAAKALRDSMAAATNTSSARMAQVATTAAMHHRDGSAALLFRDTPWCNGAVWSINPNPHLPGDLNGATVHWNDQTKKQLYGPKARGVLDGEYLDSLEGYVTADLNFRRDHFRYTTVPLTFDSVSKEPALHKGLAVFEFTRWFADDVHRLGKLTFANGVPYRFGFLCPWLDVLGTETDWLSNRKYRPSSQAQMNYWRTLSGRKPYVLLMNTDYNDFTPDKVEKYFQRCLFYGMFPSMFSHNASENPYWGNPKWFNRDRPLFKKYIPLIKRIAEVGWQPVTGADCDNPAVWLERFGAQDAQTFYLTLFNDTPQPQTTRLILHGRTGGAADLLSEQKFTAETLWKVTVAPESVMLLQVQSTPSAL